MANEAGPGRAEIERVPVAIGEDATPTNGHGAAEARGLTTSSPAHNAVSAPDPGSEPEGPATAGSGCGEEVERIDAELARLAADLDTGARSGIRLDEQLGSMLRDGRSADAVALAEEWFARSDVACAAAAERWSDLFRRCHSAGLVTSGSEDAAAESELRQVADALGAARQRVEAARRELAEELAGLAVLKGGGHKRKKRRHRHRQRVEDAQREYAESSSEVVRLTTRTGELSARQVSALRDQLPARRDSRPEVPNVTAPADEPTTEPGAPTPATLETAVRGPEHVDAPIEDLGSLGAAVEDFGAYVETVGGAAMRRTDELGDLLHAGRCEELLDVSLSTAASMRRHDAYFDKRMEEFGGVWTRFDLGVDVATLRERGRGRLRTVQRLDALSADLENVDELRRELEVDRAAGGTSWGKRREAERLRVGSRLASLSEAAADGASALGQLCAEVARADGEIARILGTGVHAASSAGSRSGTDISGPLIVPYVADEIRKLHELMVAGIITAGEFERQKAKLLAI